MTDIVYGIRITGEASGAKKAFEDTRQAQDKLTGAEKDNSRAAAEVERSNERKTAALGRLKLAALAAGAAMLLALRQMTSAAVEAERSIARLNAVWNSTGGSSGLSRAGIEGLVQRTVDTSRFDDESIRDAISVLSTFRQVSGQAFEDTIKLATGMSEVLGTDLQSAVVMLGRALEDPVNGLDALRRVGVLFSDGQKEVIKTLVETGRAAEAQQIVLRELKTKGFDVVADAMNQGMAGAMSGAKKNWNDVLEAFGKTSLVQAPVTGFFGSLAEYLKRVKLVVEDGTWLERLTFFTVGYSSKRIEDLANAPGARDDSSPEAADARRAAQQAQWQAAFDAQQAQLREFLKKRNEEWKKADDERAQSQASSATAYARIVGSQQQVMDDVIAQSPEFIRAQDARRFALEKEGEAVRDALNPWNAYAREVERLRGLLERGVISQREFGEAVALEAKKVGGAYQEMADKGNDAFKELQFAVEGWGRDTSRALASMAVSGRFSFKSLGDAARDFAEELIAIQIQNRMMKPLLASGTSFIDGLLNPGLGGGLDAGYTGYTGHTGGIVGAGGIGGNPGRYVHPAYFENAPRLHRGGLAVNEVPAILERGEEVLTRRDPRHQANGGGMGVTVNVINQTGQQFEAKASPVRFDAGGAVVDLMLRRLATDAGAREQLGGMLKGPGNY